MEAIDNIGRDEAADRLTVGQNGAQQVAHPTLDGLDREIAAVLQMDARATWRQVAGIVGASESTVKRRAERLFRSGVLRSTVMTRSVIQDTYVLAQCTCELENVVEVARLLAARDDVRFVALVTGPFDVVAEVVVPSPRELATLLLHDLTKIPGVAHITTETEVRNFKTGYDWSRDLIDARAYEPRRVSPASVPLAARSLDEVDKRLIEGLRVDGRATFANLSARTGITESMVRRRFENLTNWGGMQVITLVAPQLLGYEVELLLWLRVDLSQLENVATALSARREVRYVSATYGYSDLFCEVIMRSQEDVYDFMINVLGPLPGIQRVDTASELVTLKRAHVLLE